MLVDWTGVIIPVLGIVATFFFSYYMWIVSTNHQRKNIAIALKTDIHKVVERIGPIADREIIQKASSASEDNSQFILPFFDKEDFYYKTVRTEISTFAPQLAELIHDFYDKLADAEGLRKILIAGEHEKFDDKLFNCLDSMGNLTQQIIPLLDVEIRWSILIPHGNKPRSQLGQTAISLGKVVAAFCIILLVIMGVSTLISAPNEKTTQTVGYSPAMQSQIDYNSYMDNGTSYTYPTYSYPTYTYTVWTTPTPPPDILLSLGQMGTFTDKQITVYSAKRTGSILVHSSSDYAGEPITWTQNATKGKVYVILDIEVKTLSSDGTFLLGPYIRDSEGDRYFSTTYPGEDALPLRLYQDQHKRGKILFEIPENAKELKYIVEGYTGSSYPSKQKTIWTIPDEIQIPFFR